MVSCFFFFFFQAEDGIRDYKVTGVQTCALPIWYLDIMRNRVREQRTQRGMSQAEVAAALGVSRQTVISIESGRYLPSLPLAFRIARFFDLPVDKMFDPEEEGT